MACRNPQKAERDRGLRWKITGVIAEAMMKWLGNVFDHPSLSSFNSQPINFDKNTIIQSVINGVIPSEK
jgi:hypothetical protein